MRYPTLLLFSFLINFVLVEKSFPQSNPPVNDAVADTAIYDDRTPSDGHELQLPQMAMSTADYNSWLHEQYRKSPYIKANLAYTKLEVVQTVEKDGRVSAYQVEGNGTPEMKAELIRLLKQMPNYIPGTRDDKTVRFRIYQTFEFKYN